MTRAFRACARVIAALAVLGLAGCPFTPDQDDGNGHEPPPVQFLARTSPENLLKNLMAAYQERNVVEYESLLAEDFDFIFCAYDQAQPNIPDSWGRVEEIEAHEGIFDGEFVQSLSLQFEYSQPVFDEEHFDGVDSLWVVDVTALRLELFGTPRSTPDEPAQTFKVQDGQVTMRFRKDAGNFFEGKQVWKIAEMEETTVITP